MIIFLPAIVLFSLLDAAGFTCSPAFFLFDHKKTVPRYDFQRPSFKFIPGRVHISLFALAGSCPALHNGLMSWITQTPRGVILAIHATPRASKAGIQGLHGHALKVRLRAPPVDGKANTALIEYLAEVLDVPQRNISILSGETARHKRVLVANVDLATIALRIGLPVPAGD
jgi:uncharacterized protein (TIGR00251 family)